MIKSTTKEIAALSRLFSSAVVQELARKGRSALFSRLLQQSGLSTAAVPGAKVAEAFEIAFDTLKRVGLRDEYVYRSAISHKILMGTHSLRTASMLSEFRAGSARADLVILNGTATVYEIKSERDSLTRLATQVSEYRKVFAKVNVIASENHIDRVMASVPEEVGILCLSRRYSITTEREACHSFEAICPVTVLSSLRSNEATAVAEAMGYEVPSVPNTLLFGALGEIFQSMHPEQLHREMVNVLKRSRTLMPLNDLIDRLPDSLHAAVLSIPIRRADHGRLVDSMSIPLSVAMAWS